MASNSKIELFGETLIDLTEDTVTADKILSGYTAHDASGELITGTYEVESDDEPVDELWLPKDENTVYCLVDCDKLNRIKQFCMALSAGSGTIYGTVGHLENYEFVADGTRKASSTSSRFDMSEYTGYKVVKFEIPTTCTRLGFRGYLDGHGTIDTTLFQYDFPIVSVAWNFGRLDSAYAVMTNETIRFVLSVETTVYSLTSNLGNLSSKPFIEYIDIEKLAISYNSTSFLSSWFSNDYNLKTLKLPESIEAPKCTTNANTFSNCYLLKKIPATFSNMVVTTSVASMFLGCNSLEQVGAIEDTIDLSNSGFTNKVTTTASMFSACYSVKHIKLNINFTNVTTMGSMFANCRDLIDVDVDFSTLTTKLTTTGLSSLFNGCYELLELPDMTNLPLTNITSTASMFAYCYSLSEIDLTTTIPNTTKLTTTASMFAYCYELESINMTGWNLSGVTNVSYMFAGCNKLKEIPEVFKTVTGAIVSSGLNYLFQYCESLTEIDISHLNVTSVSSLSYTFYFCSSCTTLNMDGLNFSKATSTSSNPFRYMYSLTDVSMDGTTLCPVSISFAESSKLTYESVLQIINALPTVSTTKTLTLHATPKALLTDDDKAIATGKGWSIA